MISKSSTSVSGRQVCGHGVKKGWQIVRFGDVVRNTKETVDRDNTELTRYVAGEHMDSDDFHLRHWGEMDGDYLGPAFHRAFRKGQVLYGSRRTYLKKVSLAPFDGICANTTFVLESCDSDVLLPDLLPFLMLTDTFTQHSIRESKGSVNPYVNWKDIAKYEFPLPPKDEQHRIAEILWAADDVVERYREVEDATNKLIAASTAAFLNRNWATVPCEKLLLEGPRNGLSPNCNAAHKGFPTLAIGAVRHGRIVPEGNLKYAEVSREDMERCQLSPGDVLVVRGNGNRGLCGKCGMVDIVPDNCFYPDLLIRLRFDATKICPMFAVLQWNTALVHNQLLRRAKSTNGIWKINGKDIRQHRLATPPLDAQQRFVTHLSKPQRVVQSIVRLLLSVRQTKQSLLTELLQGQCSVH